MTPDERAEKLVDKFWGSTEPTVIDRQMVKAIAAEIRAAVEEEKNLTRRELECAHKIVDGMQGLSDHIQDIIKEAKADAYQDAARIVDLFATDPYTSDTGAEAENMAAAIRARAAEVGK